MRSEDLSVFQRWAEIEITSPSPRKVKHTAIGVEYIYRSHCLEDWAAWENSQGISGGQWLESVPWGVLVLGDLSEARIGTGFETFAQTDQYRAPEVTLGMPWGSKVDIWNIALMVSAFTSFR